MVLVDYLQKADSVLQRVEFCGGSCFLDKEPELLFSRQCIAIQIWLGKSFNNTLTADI